MRRYALWVAVLLMSSMAASGGVSRLTVQLERHGELVWSRGAAPVLRVFPQRGDGWYVLARRYCGTPAAVRTLKRANPGVGSPMLGRSVAIPITILREDLRVASVHRLFPIDRRVQGGWRHHVLNPFGIGSEGWGFLAELFTGNRSRERLLRRVNPEISARGLKRGQVILIPEAYLLRGFRSQAIGREFVPRGVGAKGEARASARRPESTPSPRWTPPPVASGGEIPPRVGKPGPAALTYGRDRLGAYAIYRLRPGEALYSAVVVRFTGQLHAAEVNATALGIARRSGIRDVTSIPIGYSIKIPLDLLLPEYLPPGHPRRVEWEADRKSLQRFVQVVHASQLAGVQVILDAGHGGCDSGAVSQGVWESTYAYDLLCRIKADLERYTKATVWTTLKDRSRGYRIPNRDVLIQDRDQFLLTHPRFPLSDSTTGVHLRWYLTNDIVLRKRKDRVPATKIVFISIHADSLFQTVRGAMVYVPSRYLRPKTFSVGRKVMNGFREYRRHPRVVLSPRFKARAEASSRRLAGKILSSIRRSDLAVHRYEPVRSSVLRGRRRWVPAVLRYSLAQNAVLLECCNLANAQDRKALLDHTWREKFSRAVVRGLAEAYGSR